MNAPSNFVARQARRGAALALLVPLYLLARLPTIGDEERAALAQRFHFTRHLLPDVGDRQHASERPVHPSLAHIAGWISTLGASVALCDLDRDGLANDVVWVDTRTNQVLVAPAPGTPARYAPFALDWSALSYDEATMAPMGCVPNDMNEDGWQDILVYFWGRTPIALLRKTPPGALASSTLGARDFVARELVRDQERWYTNAATFADFDGDGHVDLVLGNYFKDGARILDAHADGVEEMQDSMTRAFNGGKKHFFLWQSAQAGADPAVTFAEQHDVIDPSIATPWTLAVGAADLDGDLLPEIYFGNDFGPDQLYHNRSKPGHLEFALLHGEKTLTSPNSKVVGRDSFKGMGVDFGDLNGDGLLDIYVSNITTEFGLEESQFAYVSTGDTARMKDGIAPYVDRSEDLGLSRSGWAWEARLADFDNDGVLEAMQALGFLRGTKNRWPELHEAAMGNDQLLHHPGVWHRFLAGDDLSGHQHDAFFARASDGRYYEIGDAVGLGDVQMSRAIATADVDGDGDLDIAIGNQWESSAFYTNEARGSGSFLGLHLLVPLSGQETIVRDGHPETLLSARPAIGASTRVKLPDGRTLVAQVDGGNGHAGARSPDLHFGLGSIAPDALLAVEIAWRDSAGQVHRHTFDLAPGWHTIVLGNSKEQG